MRMVPQGYNLDCKISKANKASKGLTVGGRRPGRDSFYCMWFILTFEVISQDRVDKSGCIPSSLSVRYIVHQFTETIEH